ncbi:Glycosyltransferase family 2 protein [Sulfidibacter corallicola]|uniref:Glycosyltransferase family 2 protein n=1 Tax=Sulfidibacter corallicola TaxID=2818388 RepID=A0A8A4TML4_SULCO|nr:glycosyltransferase family 2 protein [Sulfidibacter corallicola]QTD50790.1 glycosyltransferase family 2 protein [Sulfidibacter corallicola]
MYKGLSVTVVIPCLNEESGIKAVLGAAPDWVDQVIVVDNGSTDRTADVARELGAIVVSEDLRGYGRAYMRGFKHAETDIICTLDGDHSYPIHDLGRLIDVFLEYKVDFLSACRFPILNQESMSFKHWIGNKILSFVMAILFKFPIEDSQSGMWVFRRQILEKINLTSPGMAFSEEIKIEVIRNPDVRFKEEHIKYSARKGEIKLQPYRDGIRNIAFLFRKRFLG